MISENIIEYKDVLDSMNQNGQDKTLLLGNGFSIAYNPQRFSFTHLKDSAVQQNILASGSSILKLFEQFNTADFEKIIRLLNDYVKIDRILHPEKDLSSLKQKIEELKQHLVDTITNNHPDTVNSLTVREYDSACAFVKEYKRIYTLNYDLLLYWVTMKLLSNKEETDESFPLNINDGFGSSVADEEYVSFKNEGKNQFGVFYLHGALHIFDNKDEIIKLTFSRTDIPLKQQIKKNLDDEIYPVFISEGTSSEKQEKIIHNAYLNHCFRSLKSIKGNLVIFGTLLKRNDQHIQDAICRNNCENIYIGLFDENNDRRELDSFVSKLEEHPVHKGRKTINRNICFFNSKSIDVWGHQNISLNQY